MRYLLSISAIILFMLASCSKGSVETNEEQTPVCFATIMSRASTIDSGSTLADAGGFSVWAYSYASLWNIADTRTPLLTDKEVTSTDGILWTYDNPVNWPIDQHVSFFAYAPAGSAAIGGVDADGIPVISYAISSSPASQADLLISTPVWDQQGANYLGNTPVNLRFNHALSQIKFSAILSGAFTDEVVKVTKVKLRNIYYQGETTLQTPISWEVETSAVSSYELTTSNGLSGAILTTTAQDISLPSGMLFLMPQAIDRNSDQPEMDVTFTIDGAEVSYTVEMFSTASWLPGKSYNYQLCIDKGSLQLIVIDGDIGLTLWNVSIMIQPVPLTKNQGRDLTRINSALQSLANLNIDGNIDLSVANCKYFALYLKNDVNHDITISMDPYDSMFTEGEYVMFDAKKIVGEWNKDEETSAYYTFTVNYNPLYWTLGTSAQPVDGATLDPPVDGYTYATTVNPVNHIENKGSIIFIRTNEVVPENP